MTNKHRDYKVANGDFSDEFLEYTKNEWEPVLGKNVSTEEAREIVENFVALELLLRELRAKYGPVASDWESRI